ncbi:hypothetical protein BZG36_00185 [Bifiguratus adelaidae]|uniref:Transcription elongation factor Eaf N-terminal domain-containing protein n=1 Tax=Bifiguratus adelaidae TaxID=1938954 RepID=A0A261Y8C3_9FUNG|nr:hypothetical protein BZG36_00185 [Bifiguratus adelaidae]
MVVDEAVPGAVYYSIRYNFRPESIDTTKPGVLKETDQACVIELPSKEGGDTIPYEGDIESGRDIDCLLIYDEETQTFTLERQAFSISAKNRRKGRQGKEIPTINLPPSTSQVTTPNVDMLLTPTLQDSFPKTDDEIEADVFEEELGKEMDEILFEEDAVPSDKAHEASQSHGTNGSHSKPVTPKPDRITPLPTPILHQNHPSPRPVPKSKPVRPTSLAVASPKSSPLSSHFGPVATKTGKPSGSSSGSQSSSGSGSSSSGSGSSESESGSEDDNFMTDLEADISNTLSQAPAPQQPPPGHSTPRSGPMSLKAMLRGNTPNSQAAEEELSSSDDD